MSGSSRISRTNALGIGVQLGVLALGTALLVGCGGTAESGSPEGATSDEFLPFTEIPRPAANQELADRVPAPIREKGSLTVALDVYPTAVIAPPDGGDLRGWEVSTAQALGAVLDLDMNFEKTSFDSMLPGLVSNRYDVVMSSWAATEDRMKEVTFVTAHYTDISLLVREDSDFTADSTLALCGQRLGLIAGSVQVRDLEEVQQGECADAGLPAIEMQTFKTINEAILALEAERIDVQASATDMHVYLMSQQPGVFKSVLRYESPTSTTAYEDVPAGTSGIALGRETEYWEELAEVLRDALNGLIEDGTHQAILDQWNSGFGGIEKSVVVPR